MPHNNIPVKRRAVFYIPGFDPFPPRRYRELYRREAATQAKLSNYQITMLPKTSQGEFGWQVAATIDGQDVHSDFIVLTWSDIVRDNMQGGTLATYWQLIRTAWIYITTGVLWRLMRLRKGPVIAALYPVLMLLGQLALALLLAIIAARAIASLGDALPVVVLAVLVAGLVGWLVLWGFGRLDGRLYVRYLMQDYAFSAADWGDTPHALRQRIAQFVARVAQALDEDVDEVLLVGHSSGAHLAVEVAAGLIRQRTLSGQGPQLSLLTLGQVVPMVSFLPKADRLRADLALVSRDPNLAWVDVSAPGDGCCFALCDPVAVSGAATVDKKGPLVVSAAFSKTLSPRRWRELRWRFFRLHFQYLCAFDRPAGYDYFQITAGPQTLAHRFAGRKPSSSRIERQASAYRVGPG